MRRPRSRSGCAAPRTRSSFQPTPTPRIVRPPDSRSSVAHSFAKATGSRNGSTSTRVPRRIVRVTPASAREERDRLQPRHAIGRRRDEQVIDEHRRVEAEVLGATQVRAHLREVAVSGPSAKLGRRRPKRIALSGRRAAGPPPPTTSAARAAGGVFRLRPIMTSPSMRTIEMPGRSPMRERAERVVARPTRSAHRPARCPRRGPGARPRRRARGRAPCCRSRRRPRPPARRPPSEPGAPSRRRIPSGTTPVPTGASLPMITRRRGRRPRPRAAQRVERGPAVAAVDDLDRHVRVDDALDVARRTSRSCRR